MKVDLEVVEAGGAGDDQRYSQREDTVTVYITSVIVPESVESQSLAKSFPSFFFRVLLIIFSVLPSSRVHLCSLICRISNPARRF